jgi:hypothetical protein
VFPLRLVMPAYLASGNIYRATGIVQVAVNGVYVTDDELDEHPSSS